MDGGNFWNEYWREVFAGVTLAALSTVGLIFRNRITDIVRVLVNPIPTPQSQLVDDVIRITSPAPMQGLIGKTPQGDKGFSYEVKGKLKSLPSKHVIWLIVQDENSNRVWPQCTFRVKYNPEDGIWSGRVYIGVNHKTAKLVAVVAPPTSNEFFNYFCANGNKTEWAPIGQIPSECSNVHEVSVVVT